MRFETSRRGVWLAPCLPGLQWRPIRIIRSGRYQAAIIKWRTNVAHLPPDGYKRTAGIKMQNVPDKASTEVVVGLLNREVDVAAVTLSTAAAQVASKSFRELAVSTPNRTSAMPDIPTVNEVVGSDSYDFSDWVGATVPAGTPRAIAAKLHDDMVEVLRRPEIRKKLVEMGWEEVDNTPEEFRALLQRDIAN